MEKEDLIYELRDILDTLDDIDTKINDIMATPVEDLGDFINGGHTYYGARKEGLAEISRNLLGQLGHLIEKLEQESEE